MPLSDVQTDILKALKDLERSQFVEFCDLLSRDDTEPRIFSSEVEKRSRPKVTKLLVSRCTEVGALDRTINTLRLMGCNNEAHKLESTNKTCLDSPAKVVGCTGKKPVWPLRVRKDNEQKKNQNGKKAVAKTKTTVEPGCTTLQFGKYEGKSFKWLVKKDVGYLAYVVATHEKEREEGNTSQARRMKHKDALSYYASGFPEAVKEIHFHRRGLDPLGFGKKYPNVILQDLHNSDDKDMKSYVTYLRGMEKTCTKGSPMESVIEYILHRDKTKTCGLRTSPRRTSAGGHLPGGHLPGGLLPGGLLPGGHLPGWTTRPYAESEPAVKKQRL